MTLPDEAIITDSPTDDWDQRVVDPPGGHVYQSVAWAEHRRRSGWRPRFVRIAGQPVLVLVRPWPLIGGGSAYAPRGPAPIAPGEAVGRVLMATLTALKAETDVLAVDGEVPASAGAYRDALSRAGFRPIPEIQPSRHRIGLPLAGADEAAAFEGIARSTRQRIRKAENDGLTVVRHDARVAPDGVGDGFAVPAEEVGVVLDRFYDLLLEIGERRQFTFGPRGSFVGWWQAAHAAGHLVLLEARAADGGPLAGLLLYRHGERLSTVHSGDHAATRRDHPGALHLLRWRAIQLALREDRAEMDLGGADVAGARREPREGEPMWGLYQHKLSFGGQWVELAGAHEAVIRPGRYQAGRVVARLARIVGRGSRA